ncbi:helix-turn-helix transcriptional regulator [Sporosarcina highlanderae]|uniref:Helix-turn-helix transcriptional regulator n=1 Tax=Sporosarcina highlanderae TaxID=3035916 RepID=A0ABT8JU16_9BACL|nr:helix-turn-helix transcriptional regulator [Sporosarcina highlanderae]MDN4608635.1 helix-turn-helix transcriptional regulator [Sporosarcina highlanderae]
MDSNSGKILRDIRFENRMTQQQLADELGVSRSHIAHIEAGRREISRATKIRLAQVVDISASLSFFERLKEIDKIFPSKP